MMMPSGQANPTMMPGGGTAKLDPERNLRHAIDAGYEEFVYRLETSCVDRDAAFRMGVLRVLEILRTGAYYTIDGGPIVRDPDALHRWIEDKQADLSPREEFEHKKKLIAELKMAREEAEIRAAKAEEAARMAAEATEAPTMSSVLPPLHVYPNTLTDAVIADLLKQAGMAVIRWGWDR